MCIMEQYYVAPKFNRTQMIDQCANSLDAISLEPWDEIDDENDYVGPGELNTRQCFSLTSLITWFETKLRAKKYPTDPTNKVRVDFNVLRTLCARYIRNGNILPPYLHNYMMPPAPEVETTVSTDFINRIKILKFLPINIMVTPVMRNTPNRLNYLDDLLGVNVQFSTLVERSHMEYMRFFDDRIPTEQFYQNIWNILNDADRQAISVIHYEVPTPVSLKFINRLKNSNRYILKLKVVPIFRNIQGRSYKVDRVIGRELDVQTLFTALALKFSLLDRYKLLWDILSNTDRLLVEDALELPASWQAKEGVRMPKVNTNGPKPRRK